MQERQSQRPTHQTARGKLRALSGGQGAPSVTFDPTTDAFIRGLAAKGAPPIYTLSPAEARDVLLGVQSATTFAAPPADLDDRTIPVGPTGTVPIRIVRPRGVAGPLPTVIYIHGGGWILGDRQTHDRLVREIANGVPAAVVFVDYARSPEARYPVAIEQAYAVTEWVAEHGTEAGLDASRLAVVGDSVGGNMTAAVAMLAKERGGPRLDFQALFYPVTDASFGTPSYEQFADGPWLTREAMKWFWDAYAPDVATRAEPTASPLRAPIEKLAGLPPALVITNEADVLRDEGEAYARRLTAAGVRVTAIRYLGAIHDMMLLNPIANTPAPRAAIAEACVALRRALAR